MTNMTRTYTARVTFKVGNTEGQKVLTSEDSLAHFVAFLEANKAQILSIDETIEMTNTKHQGYQTSEELLAAYNETEETCKETSYGCDCGCEDHHEHKTDEEKYNDFQEKEELTYSELRDILTTRLTKDLNQVVNVLRAIHR